METDKIPQEISVAQAPLENVPVHKGFLNQKGNFPLILGVVIITLVVLGAARYLLTTNKNSNSNQYTPQSTPTSTQPTSLNETANWKTYTNTEENFLLKYPNEWHLRENKTERNAFITLLEIKSPETKFTVDDSPFSMYEVLISTKNKKGEITISQAVDQIIQEPRSPGIVMDERKKIVVDGVDAERIMFRQDTGLEHVVIYAIFKNKIYIITFTASFITDELVEKFNEEFKTLTNQIISTFRFIN